MHPILAKRSRAVLYLAAFAPAGALFGELLERGPESRFVVWALLVPLTVFHAFSCLASWYLVRSFPLRTTRAEMLLAIHLAAGLLASVFLVVLGRAWATALGSFDVGVTGLLDANRIRLGVFALLLYSLAVALHYVVFALEESQEAERRAYEHRLLAREAELKVLRTQIDPHFLFNSLNAVAGLVSSDPKQARTMCVELAAFLRESLKLGGEPWISLDKEIRLVERYLAVERIRFGERLRTDVALADGCGDCRVPPLLLQPLVENAVRHGIAHLVDGGSLSVHGAARDDRLRIVVTNDHDPESPRRRGAGIGLENVRRRLAALYGSDAALEVRDDGGGVFRVEIELPARERDDEGDNDV